MPIDEKIPKHLKSLLAKDEEVLWLYEIPTKISEALWVSGFLALIFFGVLAVNPEENLITQVLVFALFALMVVGMFFNALYSKTCYAITNQRILGYLKEKEQHPFSFSLILVQDAILSKPRNGAVDILLYDKHNPTGELPQPIGILEGIAEDEAQSAYELLRQAREDALNTRAQELGID